MSDEDMLQRMTELKLRMLREKMQKESGQQQFQSQQALQNQYYQSMQAQQMQAQQMHAQQMQAQYYNQMMMMQKQQQLKEAEAANRRLKDQLNDLQARQGYRKNDQMAAMEKMVEQLSEKLDKPKEADSKLDTILAQSLQMQNMLLAQMQSGQGMFGQAQQSALGPDGAARNDPHGPRHHDNHQQHHQGHTQEDLRAAAQNQRDEQLLNDMRALTDQLSKADIEARESAEQAVKAYQEQESPQKGAGGRYRVF